MEGQTDLSEIIKNMSPYLNESDYVFVCVNDNINFSDEAIVCQFREEEGITMIIKKDKADKLDLSYDFVASWITLKIHSSLNAVGFTAVISAELTKHNISCNVVAGYHHDHLFVNVKDKEKAIQVLKELSNNY